MITTGIASAVGYAATLYSYNLGRFQFDSNQQQNTAHQNQNMRLAQWSLFREDVRDLFSLTSSNMNTYMVVGTLIVSCAMNFIWNGYKDYPMEPPWLLLLWNNCVFICIIFGVLSVWLAMHGSISSNSACVKILTQAVRPPIPSYSEVQAVRAAQEHFERAGTVKFLQLPRFFSGAPLNSDRDEVRRSKSFPQRRGSSHELQPTPDAPARRTMSSALVQPRTQASAPEILSPSGAPQRRVSVATNLEEAAEVSARHPVGELLEEVDGGPGSSAVFHSHFRLLRQVQRSYASFDAYARISLAVSAHQLLLVDAYYALGHFMSKTEGWPSPTQNTHGAWLALVAAVFGSVVLLRLDLFITRARMRLVQVSLIAGPSFAGFAAHLFAIRTKHGAGGVNACEQVVPAAVPWVLALLACVFHVFALEVLLFQARPAAGNARLPLSFRSARYLDVFGWQKEHFSGLGFGQEDEATSSASIDMMPERQTSIGIHKGEIDEEEELGRSLDDRARSALQQARKLLRIIRRLLRPGALEHVTAKEANALHDLKFELEMQLEAFANNAHEAAGLGNGRAGHGAGLGASLPFSREASHFSRQLSPSANVWLQCECNVDTGMAVPYWVRSGSGEVTWEAPKHGQTLDLSELTHSVQVLHHRVRSLGSIDLERAIWDPENPRQALHAAQLPSIVEDTHATGSTAPFELMPERPDSLSHGGSLPWKYFRMTIRACSGLWIMAMLFIASDDKYYDSLKAPREKYDGAVVRQLNVSWPHKFFRPSAIACGRTGRTLIVGDQFSIFAAELPQGEAFHKLHLHRRPPQSVKLEQAFPEADLSSVPWKGFGVLCASNCKHGWSAARGLLLLSQDGRVVVERPLGVRRYTDVSRHWTVTPILGATIESIRPVEGKAAAMCGQRRGTAGAFRDGLSVFAGRGPGPRRAFLLPTWALYAATDQGQVVILCPGRGGILRPLHVVASLQRRRSVPWAVGVVGSHDGQVKVAREKLVGVHIDIEAGTLWLIAACTDGRAELRSWGLLDGEARGHWHLPSGRRWAPGLCPVEGGKGLLLAASAELSPAAGPELWHLKV